ncbi:hypothetical protein L596_028335 [Steinernema carpocapsae]|uniref:Endonuclease/exonuclease/phosphatase domain-containing protein n=1 Tax=Steinernema carpocapsae TaxID=34508 RepID=A0A4U5LY50_STECR|nr:hypothetical protein L596_028335 [Steinernema carpocapsae]
MTLQSCAQPLPPEAEASIKSRNPRPKPDLRKPVFIPKNYVFKRGPPGRYAVRILDSPGQPTKNYAIRNIEFYKKSADSVNEEFADSLSYHAAKILKVALRTWTILQNKPKKSHDFRLCSYNVLCQTTLEQTKFLYARQDERFLEWGYRSVKFEKELPALDADVFCLQEVNLLHFKSFFLPLFKKLGFEGRFEQKPKRDDGCAIFFKSSVFKQVAYRRVDLFHSDDSTLNKPNVGQIIRLRHEPSKREICVANTHLVFGKKLGATKFVQMALMLAHLKVVLDKGSKADYVLCGDLNIEPFSDIYAFLIRKELNLDKCVEALMSGQDFFAREKSRPTLRIPAEVGLISDCTLAKKQPKSDANSATKWTHGLDFVSVYNHLRPDKTRDMSTFHSKEALNPDFIFYSIEYVAEERGVLQVKESGLKLLNRLELPNISEANAAFGPWPNKFTPSDHVPLLVDFAFVQ